MPTQPKPSSKDLTKLGGLETSFLNGRERESLKLETSTYVSLFDTLAGHLVAWVLSLVGPCYLGL